MSRWFRLYADAMRNPKVARLSDSDFRIWVRLLAVASENDGAIPPAEDLKHLLSVRLDYLSKALERLLKGGLIDPLASGYEPHNWSKFQYKSDTSTERVHKHRAKRNVSVTPPETDTEAETERTVANATVARASPQPLQDALNDWNEAAVKTGWPVVLKFTDARQANLRARLRGESLEGWRAAIARARASPLLGRDPPPWFTFDFIVKSGNYAKLIEGNYDRQHANGNGAANGYGRPSRRSDEIDDAARRLGFEG